MKPVLLVTGASRGIGAATAVLAAQQGWRVVVNYSTNRTAADQVVSQIEQAGGEAFAVQADVGDEAQIMAMFQRIDSQWGRLDGLVNNAGVVDMPSRVDEMTVPRLERMFRLNVIGSFLCAREAVRRYEKLHIERMLRECDDKREAARRMGIGLSSLYRRMAELGIQLDQDEE
mgnify:CR=1 FL=1